MDILGLGVEQPDGADMVGDAVNTERDHRLRCVGGGVEPFRRPIHPDICGLRRQHDSHQKRVGIFILQFGLGFGKPRRHAHETFLDMGKLHLAGAGLGCHGCVTPSQNAGKCWTGRKIALISNAAQFDGPVHII